MRIEYPNVKFELDSILNWQVEICANYEVGSSFKIDSLTINAHSDNLYTRNIYWFIKNQKLLGFRSAIKGLYEYNIAHPVLHPPADKDWNIQVFKMSGKKKQSASAEVVERTEEDFMFAFKSQCENKDWILDLHCALAKNEEMRRIKNLNQLSIEVAEMYQLVEGLKNSE